MANNNDPYINKSDLETILQVNKKAIEIQTIVAEQYEEITENSESLANKMHDVDKKIDNIERELYKVQVLFITGIIGIIMQLIQFFLRK